MAFKPVTKSDEDGKSGWLQHATQIVGLFAGIATIVYLAGGLVMTLRLVFARLPWESVVSQLPREFLVSIGAGQVLLPSLLVGAAYGLFRLLRADRTEAPTLPRMRDVLGELRERHQPRGLPLLLRKYAITFALLAFPPVIVLGFRLFNSDLEWGSKWVILGGLALLFVIAASVHEARAAIIRSDHRLLRPWGGARAAAVMAGVYAVAAIPAMMAAAASAPLSEARVCNLDNYSEQGFLVGETSDRVYLGEKGSDRRIAVIPFAKIGEVFIGDEAEHATCEIVSAPPTATERLEIEQRLKKGISKSFLLPENQTLADPP